MTLFYHSPGDLLLLGTFRMTLAELLVERPDYTGLPEGMLWRRYDDEGDGHHALSDGETQIAGPTPWPEGDEILANAAAIQAGVEDARTAANPPAPGQSPEQAAEALLLAHLELDALIEVIAPLLTGAPSKATLRAAIKAIIQAAL